MKKLFKIFSVTILTLITAAMVSLTCFADSPKENGSTAKEAMEQQLLVSNARESGAMNELITYTAVGGGITAAVIAVAVVIGVKSGKSKEDEE